MLSFDFYSSREPEREDPRHKLLITPLPSLKDILFFGPRLALDSSAPSALGDGWLLHFTNEETKPKRDSNQPKVTAPEWWNRDSDLGLRVKPELSPHCLLLASGEACPRAVHRLDFHVPLRPCCVPVFLE